METRGEILRVNNSKRCSKVRNEGAGDCEGGGWVSKILENVSVPLSFFFFLR